MPDPHTLHETAQALRERAQWHESPQSYLAGVDELIRAIESAVPSHTPHSPASDAH